MMFGLPAGSFRFKPQGPQLPGLPGGLPGVPGTPGLPFGLQLPPPPPAPTFSIAAPQPGRGLQDPNAALLAKNQTMLEQRQAAPPVDAFDIRQAGSAPAFAAVTDPNTDYNGKRSDSKFAKLAAQLSSANLAPEPEPEQTVVPKNGKTSFAGIANRAISDATARAGRTRVG